MNATKTERPTCKSEVRSQKSEVRTRPAVKLKFAFLQPALVAGGVPVPMFHVLEDISDAAGKLLAARSTVTILGVMGRGLEPMLEPARADLTEGEARGLGTGPVVDKFECALIALRDLRAEKDFMGAAGIMDWLQSELRGEQLAASENEAGCVPHGPLAT